MPYERHTRAWHEVPPEAAGQADTFRITADRIHWQARELLRIYATLHATWDGRSREQLLEPFRQEIGRAKELAAWLDQAAREVAQLTVYRVEQITVWVPDPTPPAALTAKVKPK